MESASTREAGTFGGDPQAPTDNLKTLCKSAWGPNAERHAKILIINHCPYVKASIDRIVAEAKALREIGIGTIAAKRHRSLSRGFA
jgi:hypothetical protein